VIPALVYAAANMPAPGHVKHTGGGNLIFGRTRDDPGDPQALREIATLLTGAGIPVQMSDHIEVELWTKLAMNCAYNAISALGGARYAQMVAMDEVRSLMRDAVNEVAQVARARGIDLPERIVEDAMKLADAMPQTLSSTAQDIQSGRRTEIDHLNGYVVRTGEALGIATPINRTLNALIKLVEQVKSDRAIE
jgi:2-dehydropantoate 2-reductase